MIDRSEEFNISNAARGWIPQIAISGQVTWQNEVASFPDAFKQMMAGSGVDMPGLKKDQYKFALDISQVIWDGGASRAGKLVAESEADEMRMSNSVDIYALNDRVSDIFFGLLLLEANCETALSVMQTWIPISRSWNLLSATEPRCKAIWTCLKLKRSLSTSR